MMKDRRVDQGMKYSPVFGRYGFLAQGEQGGTVKVGDEVNVTRKNEERTTFGECLVSCVRTQERELTRSRLAGPIECVFGQVIQ